MLSFGKHVIILLLWNLHFESLHLQLIFPKGKCFCIWLLTNVEKICVLSYKKKTSLHQSHCKCGPCPPASLPPPCPTLPEAVQLQFKNQAGFGNFVKQSVEHYTTKEKKWV